LSINDLKIKGVFMLSCVECDFSYEEILNECPRCIELDIAERPELIAVAAMTAQFITKQGSSKIEAKLGELWPESDEVSFKLISEVERKFKNKNKFHSYFTHDDSRDSAPNILNGYINEVITFKSLVHKFMESLVASARDVGVHKVGGGNIVFMHYKNQEQDDIGRLLAIWVTKKEGFDFDEETLLPKDSSHLNLDAMRQAALFDLTLFDAVYPATPDEDTYLKFIKGTSTGEFFKAAFGCDENNADNVHSIKQFRKAVSDYQDKHKLANDFYMDATTKVETLLEKAHKAGKAISLSTLCNTVDGLLPDDSPLKGTFERFINDNGYAINHHIEPTLNSVKAGKSIEVVAVDKSFTAKILRKEIGYAGTGSIVEYEEGRLTFLITDEGQKKELAKLASANMDNE
jgi:nucleoid-associated protein YejK